MRLDDPDPFLQLDDPDPAAAHDSDLWHGWYYLDSVWYTPPREFGPFSSTTMREWYTKNFFAEREDLMVRMSDWTAHRPLKEIFRDVASDAFVEAPRRGRRWLRGKLDGGGGSPGGREDDARVFKVFAADLSIDIQEDELQTIFGSHGKVMDVKIIDDRPPGSSKCAFVTYETEDAAKSANQMLSDANEMLSMAASKRSKRP